MSTSGTTFPFKRSFNLYKLIEFWRDAADDQSSILSAHAQRLLAELQNRPDLLESELTSETFKKHEDLIPYLMTPLIPVGGLHKVYAAVIPPFKLETFYETECFTELDFGNSAAGNFRIPGITANGEKIQAGKTVNAYSEILKQLTGIGGDWILPFLYTTDRDASGLRRHFKIEFDMRFVELKVNGETPDLDADDIERIQSDPFNVELWTSILPPELFEFSGFVALNATEVTIPEELSLLKDDLLRSGSMSTAADIDNLEMRLRTILRRPEIRLGLLALERTESGSISGASPIGRSLLMSDSSVPECPNKDKSYYAQAVESGQPVIVGDLKASSTTLTGFEHHLLGHGFRNLVIAPLYFEGEIVGLLEIASPNEGDISNWNVNNLMQVRGLFATAINRQIEEREDKIESIIKKQYTAIHPAVEWRFRDAAVRYLEAGPERKGHVEVEPILFKGVYPLYGLSDIRGSSTHRVESIQTDLLTQLELAMSIVKAVDRVKPLPVLDELAYQIEKHAREIRTGLSSGDEASVLEFIKSEVESRLDHLASYGLDAKAAVETYRDRLDPSLGVVYEKRRDFEDSVHMINDRIASYLETEQERAQAMFPHYFERYLTDGVDYNIYIGESLVPDGSFDPIYLRNLRLWQLMTTCGIVWELRNLNRNLAVPLETAHLILVQSTPLSIRFRDDEKQFDVDGAYNARYEIVKKRIDKATVKESGERLTQPGMIAIVYSQTREAEEYLRYVDFLLAAGYVTGEVEHLDLEDLQGVHGLKALRVQVAKTSPDVEFEVTPTGAVEPVDNL
ncbi:MAG: GAF domain-containing protein [Rhodothermia bacterium]